MPIAQAQDDGIQFDPGVLAFGDLYGVASNHDPDNAGSAGFVLRRAYLTGVSFGPALHYYPGCEHAATRSLHANSD